jgi:SAM-dependent methyltransferase
VKVESDKERKALADTFDRAASLYQKARPEYPDELFDDIVDVSGIQMGDHLLEVGCATGKATLPLARRGMRITCIEPGRHLAAIARENLQTCDVRVVETTFEEWRPGTTESFALVYAATAWKWIDPSIRYRRAWEALRPRGHLALWNAQHVFPEGGDPFFAEIQEVYEEIGEGLPPGAVQPRPGELPDDTVDIEKSGLFDVMHVRHFDWEVQCDASSYVDLLNTFSGHIAMDDWKRDRLYGEIRKRLAERPDGKLRRHWGVVLHVARRRDDD